MHYILVNLMKIILNYLKLDTYALDEAWNYHILFHINYITFSLSNKLQKLHVR